jgi:hypothetical protein
MSLKGDLSGVIEDFIPDMTTYIKQPFHIEAIDNIAFDSIETAVDTVDKAIRNKNRLRDTVYLAI